MKRYSGESAAVPDIAASTCSQRFSLLQIRPIAGSGSIAFDDVVPIVAHTKKGVSLWSRSAAICIRSSSFRVRRFSSGMRADRSLSLAPAVRDYRSGTGAERGGSARRRNPQHRGQGRTGHRRVPGRRRQRAEFSTSSSGSADLIVQGVRPEWAHRARAARPHAGGDVAFSSRPDAKVRTEIAALDTRR